VLQHTRLAITVDASPVHLASALGVPVSGPTVRHDPGSGERSHPNSRSLTQRHGGIQFGSESHPRAREIMRSISVDEVHEAASNFWRAEPGRRGVRWSRGRGLQVLRRWVLMRGPSQVRNLRRRSYGRRGASKPFISEFFGCCYSNLKFPRPFLVLLWRKVPRRWNVKFSEGGGVICVGDKRCFKTKLIRASTIMTSESRL
jgi:hypothetical protein